MQSKAPTAGWPISETHTKIDSPTNQKGCDNSETTDEKLSARRIQIFRVPVVVKYNLSRCSQQDVYDTKNTGKSVPVDHGQGLVYEALSVL